MGAGLPVISTLSDLIQTGDEMLHIEGILSGTLSFIFNSFGAGKTFSQVVADAKAKGFTEPDPREDLAGARFPAPFNGTCTDVTDNLQVFNSGISTSEQYDMCDLSGWSHIAYIYDAPQDSVNSVQSATDTVFRKHVEPDLGVCLRY